MFASPRSAGLQDRVEALEAAARASSEALAAREAEAAELREALKARDAELARLRLDLTAMGLRLEETARQGERAATALLERLEGLRTGGTASASASASARVGR